MNSENTVYQYGIIVYMLIYLFLKVIDSANDSSHRKQSLRSHLNNLIEQYIIYIYIKLLNLFLFSEI